MFHNYCTGLNNIMIIDYVLMKTSWHGRAFRITGRFVGDTIVTGGFPPQISSNAELWRFPLQWRHNEYDGVSNHQLHGCLLNLLFRRRSKKTPKLRVTGLCAGNSPVTGEYPAEMASNAEMFPFDDVIVLSGQISYWINNGFVGCFWHHDADMTLL